MKERCSVGEAKLTSRTFTFFLLSILMSTELNPSTTAVALCLCPCVCVCVCMRVCVGGEDLWSEADSSCTGQPIHLWQFLRELLLKPHNYGRCIRWVNKEKGSTASNRVEVALLATG